MGSNFAGSTRKQRLPANWRSLRRRVLRAADYRCALCGAPATEVDHIRPGDYHDISNLQAVCSTCHSHKTAREGVQARARRRALRRHPTERHPGHRGE